MKHPQEYFIGLNMSDTAIGWAVTDSSYHVLKANQKALWGVRLFDRADTAEERRTFRYARRKKERRKQRIQLLQMLFSEEIAKVDPAFFQRLRESKFSRSDKRGVCCTYALFDDPNYTDRDFYTQYPTIYHLRKALLTEHQPFDVRLVYLAIHHILKHRGHFLSETSPVAATPSFESAFAELNACLEAHGQPALILQDAPAFESVLRDISLSKIAKKKLLVSAAGITKQDAVSYAVIELLAGNKVDLRILFPDSNLKAIKISLPDLQDEAQAERIFAALGSNQALVQRIKAISDWAAVANLLHGEPYLSCSKVKCYEKHKADLALLKREVKRALPDRYTEIFHLRDAKLNNYPAYCGHKRPGTHCEYHQFKAYLQNVLKKIPAPSASVQHILAELDQATFLPIQTGLQNRIVPHSLHRQELVTILRQAENYLPFLRDQDADGQTVSDKILRIFDFKIPYCVGPLNPRSPYAWVVRKDACVRPWNFEKTVDLAATTERFIALRTASCPYLGCDVLPKDSLLYSEFLVLQALNRLRINGKPLSSEHKQQVLQNFFLKYKQVSRDKLVQHLIASDICRAEDVVSGLDDDFHDSLRSHIVFSQILSKTNDRDMVEDLIRRSMLFGKDKIALLDYIKQAYGTVLTEKEMQYICRQAFSGWGSVSRELLTEILHTDPFTGETLSIIEMLRRTTCTFSELLSDAYSFRKAIDERRQAHISQTLSLDDFFEENRAMPAARRAARQAMSLVDEIIKIMHKRTPLCIFITAPDDAPYRRHPVLTKKQLLTRYGLCGSFADAVLPQLTQETASLSQERLYLYYAQLGRCMYSGAPIDPACLDDDNTYCVVPINPFLPSIDDSLENRVLICRSAQTHADYPLPSVVRKQQTAFWCKLKNAGLISSEKYACLVRSIPFTPDALAAYIAEQMTPSDHLSKLTRKALAWQYGNETTQHYIGMPAVNRFRYQAGILLGQQAKPDFERSRAVNDHHYAKDAYLSIVIGNHLVYEVANLPAQWMQEGSSNHPDDLTDTWFGFRSDVLQTVWQTIRQNNVLFTRKAYQAHGSLFDQTLLPKGKGQTPVKSSDPRMTIENFGGYNKLKGAYFCFVEHQRNNERIRSLETVSLVHERLYQRDPIGYCERILGLQEPQILISCVKLDALFSYDGFRMHISGRSGGGKQIVFKNANQLVLDAAQQVYLEHVLHFLNHDTASAEEAASLYAITAADNLALYDAFAQKLLSFYGRMHTAPQKTILQGKKAFCALSLYEQCRVLSQMRSLYICRAASVDLSAIGGSKNGGRLLLSNAFSPRQKHPLHLISQSITGVFEHSIDLLTIANSDGCP